MIIKPSPPDLQEIYLGSLPAIGIDMTLHDIRFVEDDWESPTLGAWGLGWEVWCDGMEVSQFTYFQQVGGHDCRPVSGELTYGLERLAMYVLGFDDGNQMPFNDPDAPIPLTYGDIFREAEAEYARWNFDVADTDMLLRHFDDAEAECDRILGQPETDPKTGRRIVMALPAYDQCIKASHLFNLLDARGVISVTERQAYIGRVRAWRRCAPTPSWPPRRRHERPPLVIGFLAFLALFAAALVWAQVFAFYHRETAAPELGRLAVADYRGIDAASSPLKLRGCFRVDPAARPASTPAPDATPLVAPFWFRCFDAGRLTDDLAAGAATAYAVARDAPQGFDLMLAAYPDGRGYLWRQLNDRFE